MLLREDRRRCEQQHLLARLHHAHGRTQGDLGLAEAHVTADQTIHRTILREIVHHLFNRARLVVRLAVGEALLDAPQQLAWLVVGDAWDRLTLRVQRQQLARHLADGDARTGLHLQPRLAAELRQLRLLAIGADIARQLGDLLVWQIEAILTAEGKVEVVARHAADGACLKALEAPDAMILVDDDVAGAQITERRDRPPTSRRRGATRAEQR